MALVTEFVCVHCGQSKTEIFHNDRVCARCRTVNAALAKKHHLEKLSTLTLERRIQLIEEQLYDLDISTRLGRLESMNARY